MSGALCSLHLHYRTRTCTSTVYRLVVLYMYRTCIVGEHFVTRKVTRAAVKISLGLQHVLELGNLDSKRDWGHALVRVPLEGRGGILGPFFFCSYVLAVL